MKNHDDAIETVKAYFQSLATGDLAKLGSLLADDIVWHQPGQGSLSKTYNGKAEVFSLFGQFMEISQGTFKIDSVGALMANGDWVAATLRFSAQKPGSRISMDGVDLMKVEAGQITEVYLFSGDPQAEDDFWK